MPNGEVEGPHRGARWCRGRTISQRPRSQAASASRPLQRLLDNTFASAPSIVAPNKRFRSNPSPRTLYEAWQLMCFNGGETYQDPRIISIVIRYEEGARRGLHQDLAIKEVRPKDKAVNALVEPGEQLAADFERRRPVRCAVLYSREGESNRAYLFEGYPRRCWAAARRYALRGRSRPLALRFHVLSNGEVEGPADHVSQARRARNFDWVPPRLTTHASRPPPTMVRCSHLTLTSAPPPTPQTPGLSQRRRPRASGGHDSPHARPIHRHPSHTAGTLRPPG